jgi:hypothetical protein
MDLPGVLHPEVLARIACPAVEDEPMLVRAVTALVALTFATVGMSTPLGGAEGVASRSAPAAASTGIEGVTVDVLVGYLSGPGRSRTCLAKSSGWVDCHRFSA